MKGKCAPSFGPIGPYLVTADEIPDPQTLPLWSKSMASGCKTVPRLT